MSEGVDRQHYCNKTYMAYTWTSILNAPLWAMLTLLLFILYKDLHASSFQITLFITLRPLVSLISMYWSAHVKDRRDRLKPNIMWAVVLGNTPFFFFPLIANTEWMSWYAIFSCALYMMLSRGAMPAWMEVLKINLPEDIRKKIVSRGASLSHLGGGILALAIGYLMDDYYRIWRYLFPMTAMLNIGALFLQYRMHIQATSKSVVEEEADPVVPLRVQIMQPWTNAWQLIRMRPDFGKFLLGFMIGGFGLIIVQPALPRFFVDVLQLSYTELSAAFTFCKGIAFALTSPLWAKYLHRMNIFRFCSGVTLLATFFPLCLIAAQFHVVWVYVAYLIYGSMQGGSELSWHLSGPIFSRKDDSSLYSSVNVAMVGIRACIAPWMGNMLLSFTNPITILLLGGLLSLLASWRMASYSKRYEPQLVVR